MTTEIATVDGEIIEQRAPMTLFGTDDPTAVVERASTVATALASVINERRLYASIGGKKHVQVEGWTLLGSMLGVFAEVEWSRPLENGWEARAVARTLAGNVVGAAEAMCTATEGRWRSADPYAVRSMAQTRAVSKALRLPLGFIMQLAGYDATPAEEAPSDQPERARGGSPSSPSAPAPVQPDGALRDAVAEAAKKHGISSAGLSLMADAVGVPKGERANTDQLRAILARIEQPSSGVPTAPADGEAVPARAATSPTETPPSDGSPASPASEAATASAPASPLAVEPAPDPEALLQSALDLTGGELVDVPPKPGTKEYRALPTGVERAKAKAFWEAQVPA